MSEIKRISDTGLDSGEFARVKKAFFGSYLRSFNNVETIGNLITRYILSGINIFDFSEVFESVDLEFANGVFAEIFKEDNMAMSVVLPTDK